MHSEKEKGRYVQYDDSLLYKQSPHKITEAPCQKTAPALLQELDLPLEYVPPLEEYIDRQVHLGTLEFINRFLSKLSKSLHGYCLLKALGYEVQIEAKGKHISSLREMADHFQVHHSYIHKLTEDLAAQIKAGTPKEYCRQVTAPTGYLTMTQIMQKYKLSKPKVQEVIKKANAQTMPYRKNSKIVLESDILPLLKSFREI